ncbi:MAG: HAD family hydrolase, partial [Erysipelotrichaceae bacterium]|nr:HAD family hydrolase [Erysipelotrichaceae bacterium]
MKKEYANYIFDLYGTLVAIRTDEHSLSYWQKVCDLFREYGKDYQPEELRDRYYSSISRREEEMRRNKGCQHIEITIQDVFRELFEPVEINDKQMTDICHRFRRMSILWCYPYENTKKVLNELKSRGKKLYLLSNAQAIFTEDDVRDLGIFELLDKVYISSLEGIKKPNPDFIGKLMKDENLKPEETVMIGNDMRSDIESAQAIGIDSVFLNTFDLSDEYINGYIRDHHFSDNILIIM